MTETFKGLSGFRQIVDDFVIYDSNIEDYEQHVKEFLQCSTDHNISLNTEKCQFFKRQVTFADFQLSAEGYQVDPSITTAYPSPTNYSELRSFLGLVNQLSTSTNTLATLLGPLRPLLNTILCGLRFRKKP